MRSDYHIKDNLNNNAQQDGNGDWMDLDIIIPTIRDSSGVAVNTHIIEEKENLDSDVDEPNNHDSNSSSSEEDDMELMELIRNILD